MSEEFNDVTAESSAAQDAPAESSTASEGQKSEETLNADNVPESVPYSRFKEVNDAKREYEEKLKSFEGINPELYQAYSQFDQVLSEQPELVEAIKEKMSQGMSAQQATQEAQAEQAQGPTDYQRVTYDRYMTELDQVLDGEGIPEAHWQDVKAIVQNKAVQLNPYALNQYDAKLVKKAYDGVKTLFDGIRRNERESYVKQGKENNVPESGSASGSTAKPVHRFKDRNERVAYAAQYLREGQS